MTLLPLLVLHAILAVAPAPVQGDERAILEAVMRFIPNAVPADRTHILSEEYSPLWALTAKPTTSDPVNRSRIISRMDTNTRVTISDELVDSLRTRNRSSVSIKDLVKSRPKARDRDHFSRPGISRDGLSALFVSVSDSGGGHLLYLEKRGSEWQVIGGQVWEG